MEPLYQSYWSIIALYVLLKMDIRVIVQIPSPLIMLTEMLVLLMNLIGLIMR